MGNFVSKPPFDLTEFLSKPGSPKSNRNRRFGNTNFRPRAATEDEVAVVEPGAEEPPAVDDGKS